MQDDFTDIPEELKLEYSELLSQGFHDWTQKDYWQFLKAFRRRPIDDVEGIASEIDTKQVE